METQGGTGKKKKNPKKKKTNVVTQTPVQDKLCQILGHLN